MGSADDVRFIPSFADVLAEPPRVCRRLQLLRSWSHEQADNTRLDTPPSTKPRHPDSSIAPDTVLAAHVGRLCPGLLLPQYPNDLLFREPARLHVHPSQVMDSTHFWRRSRGSGQQTLTHHARLRAVLSRLKMRVKAGVHGRPIKPKRVENGEFYY